MRSKSPIADGRSNNAWANNVNYFFNSVNVGASASSGSLNSYGFFRTLANSIVTLSDNILNNTRIGGTGKHYAIANTNPTGWNTSASNYNVLNSSSAATVGLWSAADQTFANWKSGSASGGDANSFSGVPVTFVDAANGDLKLNFGLRPTVLESGGTAAGGITIDQEGDARPGPAGSVNGGGVAPDFGADEFDGVPLDLVAPTITYTALTNAAFTTNRVLSATVTDLFGVAGGGNAPRVYYRKNAGSYFSTQCEQALKDKAYRLPDAQTSMGLSWLHRWALAKGMQLRKKPREPEFISQLFKAPQ